MTVVSDTTAITTLLKAGQVDLLSKLLGHIIIPQAVEDELLAFHASLPAFINQHPIAHGAQRLLGTESLGRGEAEAILLAKELDAVLLLTDDRKARLAAERHGVKSAGLVSLILLAKQRGHIASMRTMLDVLARRGRFHLTEAARLEALRAAGEPV